MIETFTILGGAIALLSIFKNGSARKFFWPFVLLLVVFDGLRWEMGVDWVTHYDWFYMPAGGTRPWADGPGLGDWTDIGSKLLPGVEIGFNQYVVLMRELTDNYSVFLFITTAIFYIGIFHTVFVMTDRSLFPMFYLAGTLPWYSGSLRQLIAVMFFTFALKATIDRKLIRFLVLITSAVLFHTTAVVFVPMYFLYGVSTAFYLVIFGALFVVAAFAPTLVPILDMVVNFLGQGRSFAGRLNPPIEDSSPFLGFARKVLTVACFMGFSGAVGRSKKIDGKQWNDVRFTLMLVGLSIIFYYIGTYHINYVSSRMNIYSVILSGAVLIGLLDRGFTSKRSKLLLFVFVVFLLGVFYSRLQFMDLFHPYSSLFYNYDLIRGLQGI